MGEWLDGLRSMNDSELPFRAVKKGDSRLQTLQLSKKSTAQDVRRAAISLRRKFTEDGINARQFEALGWALKATRDAMDADELLQFLLHPDMDLGQIETDRMDFR